MGQVTHGACSCGYSCSTALGGGMNDFDTNDPFPFLCIDCAEIVTINSKLPSWLCPKCGGANVRPLSDPDLSAPGTHRGSPLSRAYDYFESMKSDLEDMTLEDRREAGCDWTEAELKEMFEDNFRRAAEVMATPCWGMHMGAYKCPRCENFSLYFESGILFD